jgi:hypothetical protein
MPLLQPQCLGRQLSRPSLDVVPHQVIQVARRQHLRPQTGESIASLGLKANSIDGTVVMQPLLGINGICSG